MRANTSRTGAAGAFYTAGQLAQRGWNASLTLGNTPRTDIVAQHAGHHRLIAVQCKTSTGTADFLLSKGCEDPSPPGRDEWFVLVTLNDAGTRSDFYVVPRNVAAGYIYVAHRAWLRCPNADGTPHNDNDVRNFERAVAAPYRERWDLLDAPADRTPYWLPQWVFDWAPHTGVPPEHPGLAAPADGFTPPATAPNWLTSPPTTPAGPA